MDVIKFNNLSKVPHLVHGFSTRFFGSMKPDDPLVDNSLSSFCQALEIKPQKIIKMQQIHSNNIQWVSQVHAGQQVKQTDGILTAEKSLYLTVLAADCISVLIFDPQKKYLGAVHAGWKGIYNEVLKEAINQLNARGSSPKEILLGIGPCIRSCCYTISIERADLFKNKFAKFNNFLKQKKGKLFLDLPEIAKQQLREVGISKQNIEDCNICTFDNNDLLFSYRKEGKKFGEFIGIIGYKI